MSFRFENYIPREPLKLGLISGYVGEVLVPRKKEGGQKWRENRNSAGRMSRVNCRWWRVKCRGSEITHFFKQAFERTYHFLPNTTMSLKRKRGRKRRRNLLRVKAAFYGSQFGDNIELEASYKAFMDGTGKCGKGPSLLEKQDKATREQISRAR